MLGFGEKESEVVETIKDIFSTGCKILTIGQYLQPGLDHMKPVEYITPEKFEEYRMLATGNRIFLCGMQSSGTIFFSCRKSCKGSINLTILA